MKINGNILFEELNTSRMRPHAQRIQRKLIELGLLDPTFRGSTIDRFKPVKTPMRNEFHVDGIIGINSQTAITRFAMYARQRGLKYEPGVMSPELFDVLIDPSTQKWFPINFNENQDEFRDIRFLKRIMRFMIANQYFIAWGPDVTNVVYVEGVDAFGATNADEMDGWNDRRIVFSVYENGNPVMMMNVAATTEPGRFYTMNPMNLNGAARIAFGQYKAWNVGLHQGTQPALVQRGPIRIHRDVNRDGKRSKHDLIEVGNAWGINQHSTRPGEPPSRVGRFSAGCLVGQSLRDHGQFMAMMMNDIRFKNNAGYLFTTCVISSDELNK